MARSWMLALSLVLAFVCLLGDSSRAAQDYEEGFDRPGSDILRTVFPRRYDADQCADMCRSDARCNSWTYVKQNVQGKDGVCYLKAGVPALVRSTCCTSGVMRRPLEANVDRPGQDYKRLIVSGQPPECQRYCEKDSSCAAWTFVREGVQGPSAVCYLKNRVPDAVGNDCCTSGVNFPF